MDKTYYTWTFNDNKNRSSLWYIIALSIVIWLSIWWFLSKQYWMSLTILLLAWLVYFVENNSEDEIKINITDLWIKLLSVENPNEAWITLYDYNNINWYSYVYENENAIYLRLNIYKKWIKTLDLKIDNSIVNELNSILPNFMEEHPRQKLNISEKIIHLLKL